ncbi:MAG: hypothetical protein ACR2O0_13880 [Rhizobiaceae bacterium]
MSAFSTMVERFKTYRNERREQRKYMDTYMAVQQLPMDVRKDIGWPTAYESQRGNF